MTDPEDISAGMEEAYDEAADSDFDAESDSDDAISSSESDPDENVSSKKDHTRFRRHAEQKGRVQPETFDLDSGDEATIKEKRARRRQARESCEKQASNSDSDGHGWKVRTRAAREKDQDDKRKTRLASVKGSTVDVNKIWEDMNRPGGLENSRSTPVESSKTEISLRKENLDPAQDSAANNSDQEPDDCHKPHRCLDEMVTIDETYEYAGEVYHQKKDVPKSSTQAQLWPLRISPLRADHRFPGDGPIRRPLRKISRFDPNINNLHTFKQNWEKSTSQDKRPKAEKLNTVEKSKMDWAAHVDQEGLQDELKEHARTKGAYLGRMEFLGQVKQKESANARVLHSSG